MSVDGDRLMTNAGDFNDEEMMTFGSCIADAPTKM